MKGCSLLPTAWFSSTAEESVVKRVCASVHQAEGTKTWKVQDGDTDNM